MISRASKYVAVTFVTAASFRASRASRSAITSQQLAGHKAVWAASQSVRCEDSPKLSAKTLSFLALLREAAARGEKTLAFVESTHFMATLSSILANHCSIQHACIDGSASSEGVNDVIDDFDASGSTLQLLLVNSQAKIDLKASSASRIIYLDSARVPPGVKKVCNSRGRVTTSWCWLDTFQTILCPLSSRPLLGRAKRDRWFIALWWQGPSRKKYMPKMPSRCPRRGVLMT